MLEFKTDVLEERSAVPPMESIDVVAVLQATFNEGDDGDRNGEWSRDIVGERFAIMEVIVESVWRGGRSGSFETFGHTWGFKVF